MRRGSRTSSSPTRASRPDAAGAPISFARFHWRFYNRFLRVVGLAFVFAGAAFVWSALSLWLRLTPERPNASPWLFVGTGVFALAVGALLLRARPFRPDLGDVPWLAGRAGGYPERRERRGVARSWWTGEYREPDA